MKLQRFVDVSESPQLTLTCHSDLDISGGREGEVAIKIYGDQDDLEIVREGDHFTITARSRCKVGCPKGTALTMPAAHGRLRVRRMDGPISVEGVHGDATLKDVGPSTIGDAKGSVRVRAVHGDLKLDQVAGDLSARGVEGTLEAGRVSGDASVRNVEGLLKIDSVAGDLSASSLDGGLVATVSGDGVLKTDFTPGCDYKLSVSGDASIRFPASANARFEITSHGDIRHKVDWSEVKKDGVTLSGLLGDGEANVEVTASGDVSLQSRSDLETFAVDIGVEEEALGLELESMAEEIERNIQQHMQRLNVQLEAKLGRIDSAAIRRKADTARRKAEQAAERARLKAERAQRRWQRVGASRPTSPTPRTPPQPEVISDEERMTVLRLVQTGKISADEAARLLEAMEG